MSVETESSGDLLLENGDILLLEHEFVGSGGAYTSGSVLDRAMYSASPTGGALATGAGNDRAVYKILSSGGGAYAAGTVLDRAVYSANPAGGTLAAGVGNDRAVYKILSLGGMAGLGSAIDRAAYWLFPTSGVTVDGGGSDRAVYGPAPTGGAIVGGRAIVAIGYLPVGGAVGGGQHDVQDLIFPMASGGAIIGGRAIIAIEFVPLGGSVASGGGMDWAVYRPAMVMAGAELAGGNGYGLWLSEVSEGGVLCLGREAASGVHYSWRRQLYHRFKVGEHVFVPSSQNGYVRQVIIGRYSINGSHIWETGIGWFPNCVVLSCEEYKAWLHGDHRARSVS